MDKLSHASRLYMGLAVALGNQRLILHDSNIFQEPYTKSEVSSIFQNQFLTRAKEVLKEFVDEMKNDMPEILDK